MVPFFHMLLKSFAFFARNLRKNQHLRKFLPRFLGILIIFVYLRNQFSPEQGRGE
jgi:hypothetical protein